jgi:glucokinase
VSIYLGVDIGGTNIKIAAVTARGRVVARGLVENDAHEGPARAFRRIHAAARTLAGSPGIDGVGIGCAGLLDRRTAVVQTSPNLPGWSRVSLRTLARRYFSVPVAIDNDATCAAYGEFSVRGGRARDLVMITLGTGVGGGVISQGRVVGGVSGFGGELGHMTIDPRGPRCRCGARGCLEAYAGSYGVVAAVRRAGRRRRRRAVPDSAWAVFARARAGDAACRDAVREVGEHLGLGVASLLNALNPGVVVLAGGIAGAFDLLEPHVRRAVKKNAFPQTARDAVIERSQLGTDAAVVGAALLARAAAGDPRKRKRPA